MRKTIFILPIALVLGVAGATLVSAQPQGPRPGGPARELPRAQRPAPTPEQIAQRRATMCGDLSARAAGRLAYLETRLELTANQRAAFNKWRDVRLASAKQRAATCATAPARRGPAAQTAQANPAERLARQEQMLRQRLADISTERPALEALWGSLTPEQRQKFTPANGPRGGMGRGEGRARFGMMGGGQRGPMGGMRRGPGGPGMMPPAPPPQ